MTARTHTTHKNHVNGIRKHKTDASHLGGLIDGAEALVEATSEMSGEKLVDIRTSLQHDLEAAREQLAKLEAGLKGQLTNVDEYVHENPWQSMGVAAAAGVLIGALAFRR